VLSNKISPLCTLSQWPNENPSGTSLFVPVAEL
jgi:hypothetical protein